VLLEVFFLRLLQIRFQFVLLLVLLQDLDEGRNIVPTKATVVAVHATGISPLTIGAVQIKRYKDVRVLVRTISKSKAVDAFVVALCAGLRQAFVEIGIKRRSDRKVKQIILVNVTGKLKHTPEVKKHPDSPDQDRNEEYDHTEHDTNETAAGAHRAGGTLRTTILLGIGRGSHDFIIVGNSRVGGVFTHRSCMLLVKWPWLEIEGGVNLQVFDRKIGVQNRYDSEKEGSCPGFDS
jgi:hypothetical protein